MGKVKTRDQRRGGKAGGGGSGGRSGRGGNDIQLKKTVGKISADISAISLGPPRSKILKKTNQPGSSLLTSNFASRIKVLNKQKKKVTFCQNLIAEGLKDPKNPLGENAKHYFKVIHPSAIAKRSSSKLTQKMGSSEAEATDSLIPDTDEALMSTANPELRRIIKRSVKSKKIRLKTKKETFKKRMDLLKLKRDEVVKAKERQQTAIVGDIHPLLQALPSFTEDEDRKTLETELAKILQEDQTKSVPKKTKHNVKKTQKAILDSLKFFEASGVSAGLISK